MVQVGKWKLAQPLGDGYYGTVYRAVAQGDLPDIAIKLVPADRHERKGRDIEGMTEKEVATHYRVSHENVVAARFPTTVVDIGGHRHLAYGMELCEENLKKRIERSTERDSILRWAVPHVLDGLEYLHEKANIVHRDLHPGNVLRAGDTWKIGDFGFARVADPSGEYGSEPVGTIQYRSPEVARGGPADRHADIYALGVMVHYLLTGRYFFLPPDRVVIDPGLPKAWRKFVEACSGPAPRPFESELRSLVPKLSSDVQPMDAFVPAPEPARFRAEMLAGRTVYKLAARGQHFRVHLRPDGSAVESPLFDPGQRWDARWTVSGGGELVIDVGPHRLVVAEEWRRGHPVFVGTEHDPESGASTEFRLVVGRGGTASPGSVMVKVADNGYCWLDRLDGTEHGGTVEEQPLFGDELWTGTWSADTDAGGVTDLHLQFGPYRLSARRAGDEWAGIERKVSPPDEPPVDFVLVDVDPSFGGGTGGS